MRSVHPLGSVIEIGAAHYDANGELSTPTGATVTLVSPSGIRYVYDELDDRIVIDIGRAVGNQRAINKTNADVLDVTDAQNQDGTGLVRCRFIGTEPNRWVGDLTVTGPGGTRDVTSFQVVVAPSPTGLPYTGPFEIG